MPRADKLSNTQHKTYTQWLIPFSISILFFLLSALIIKDNAPKGVAHTPDDIKPFIYITSSNTDNDRNFEAFFLPTKYNSKLKIKKIKKTPSYLNKVESKKEIFSGLDRLRIFGMFTNRFTESEYWTISSIQMRKTLNKKINIFFIEKFEVENDKYKFIENFYKLDTHFLFQENFLNGHSE